MEWLIFIAALMAGGALLGFLLGGLGVAISAAGCLAFFVAQLYGAADEIEGADVSAVLFILLVAPLAVGASTAAWNLRARRRERRTTSS